MNAHLRLARKSDLVAYTALLQRTCEVAFPNPKIGLTKECFPKEVFATADTQAYLLKSNLTISSNQKTWLVVEKKKLIGAITTEKKGKVSDVRGFYVAPERQGQGIGKIVWERASKFADGRPVTLEIYAHNKKSIALYKKRGFVVDTTKRQAWSHWPEWPKGVRARKLYMRRGPQRPGKVGKKK
ncbi:GNAT family N-acetyltransferase [Candidatus Kaiserbacteria bacterium]|nr:GNAT family N-acetyltransferase [Candidatus Kaiserbacteria bacterium]